MTLKTYRFNQADYSVQGKLIFLSELHKKVLVKDPYWHFFFDPPGGIVRFQPKFEAAVVKEAAAFAPGIELVLADDYDPKTNEYYGVSFLGDDILPLFHEMSVLSMSYPPYITTKPILERLNHGLINMAGVHDFRTEADMYLTLAYRRAEISPQPLRFPLAIFKWLVNRVKGN